MTLESFLDSLPNSWEDDRNISIVRTHTINGQLIIDLLFVAPDFPSGRTVTKQIVLTVVSPMAISLDFIPTHYIGIEVGHPLSWPYSDVQGELYFSGTISEPTKAVLELCDVHHSTFEGYLSLGSFLKFSGKISEGLSISSGLIARGPRKLLARFDQILKSHGATTSFLGDNISTVEEENNSGSQVLFLGGGYIVAHSFEFEVLN